MARTGDILNNYDDLFSDLFEDPVEVYNYLEGPEDEYGDHERDPHPSNPISTTGQIEYPTEPVVVTSPTGQETTLDAVIYLPDDTLVTDGGTTDDQDRELPWPSEVVDANDRRHTVVNVVDEGNGRLRCDAIDTEEGS